MMLIGSCTIRKVFQPTRQGGGRRRSPRGPGRSRGRCGHSFLQVHGGSSGQPVLDHELIEGADEEEDGDAAVEPVEEPAGRRPGLVFADGEGAGCPRRAAMVEVAGVRVVVEWVRRE